MSQVFVDGEYVGCTQDDLVEIDRRVDEANKKKSGSATRDAMAAKVLGIKTKKGAK